MSDSKNTIKTIVSLIMVFLFYIVMGFGFLFSYQINGNTHLIAFLFFFLISFPASILAVKAKNVNGLSLNTPMHIGLLILTGIYLSIFFIGTFILINQTTLSSYIFFNLIIIFLYLIIAFPIILVKTEK